MIITCTAVKGGVGKTTTAINLAGQLTQRDPTLLLDADPQESALDWSKLGRLPFPVVPLGKPVALEDYAHIVIDTEGQVSDADLKTLSGRSDLLVVPTTPDALSLRVLLKNSTLLEELRAPYKVLLTMVPPGAPRKLEECRSTLERAGVPLFKTHIRRYAAYEKAALEGRCVKEVDDDRAEAAWSDYAALATEILRC